MKKPSLAAYEIYKDGKPYVALSPNAAFRRLPKKEQLIFINQMGRLLMQMIQKMQNERT